jgi:hypothetical protein
VQSNDFWDNFGQQAPSRSGSSLFAKVNKNSILSGFKTDFRNNQLKKKISPPTGMKTGETIGEAKRNKLQNRNGLMRYV